MTVFLCSCNDQKKEPVYEETVVTDWVINGKIKTMENWSSLRDKKSDTLINDIFEVKIIPEQLNTYVIEEWEQEDTLYRIKLYEHSFNLIITKNDQPLIDTIFKKETFAAEMDTSFMNIAMFHGFWFKEYIIENDQLILHGNICKPDTDWCLYFNHIIDTETGNIEFVIPEYEGDMI